MSDDIFLWGLVIGLVLGVGVAVLWHLFGLLPAIIIDDPYDEDTELPPPSSYSGPERRQEQ